MQRGMGTAVPLPSALLSRLMNEAELVGMPLNQYCQLLLENQILLARLQMHVEKIQDQLKYLVIG